MDGVNVNTKDAVCVRSDDVISQHQYPDTPAPETSLSSENKRPLVKSYSPTRKVIRTTLAICDSQ